MSPNALFFARELPNGILAIYKTVSEELHCVIETMGNYLRDVKFAHDNRKIVLCFNDEIWIRDIFNKDYLRVLEYKGKVEKIELSTDGKWVSIISSINNGKTWHVTVWSLIKDEEDCISWGVPSKEIDTIDLSSNSNYIVLRKNNKSLIEIREVFNHGNCIQKIKMDDKAPINLIDISQNEKFIFAASKNALCLWDIQTGWSLSQMRHNLDENITEITISKNCKKAMAITSGKTIHLWNIETGQEEMPITEKSNIKSPVFSPDGNTIAYIINGVIKVRGEKYENMETIIDFDPIIEKRRIGQNWFSFSCDKKLKISVVNHEIVQVQDVETGKIVNSWDINDDIQYALISPDNKFVVVAVPEKIYVWSLRTKKMIDFFCKKYRTDAMFFSLNDKLIALHKSYDGSTIGFNYCLLSTIMEETRKRFANRLLTEEERKKYYLD